MPRRHVLIVDDTRINRDLIEMALEDEFDIALACDGEAALDAVRDCRPDVVLLDMMMPKFDGAGVLDALADDEDLVRRTFLITALGKDALPPVARDAPVAGYIQKPIDVDALREAIDALDVA